MSLPENKLSTRPIYGAFLVPEKAEPLVDFEWGGVELLDTSQGLNVYIWKCYYKDNWICIDNDIVIHKLINVENVKSLSLSFDFNMHPTIAYTVEREDKERSTFLYWYDTAQAAQTTTEYGTQYHTPQVSLDDHRLHQSANADIIFAYIKNGNLYYRQQRDRFLIERLLAENLGDAELIQIGMSTKNRFQFAFVDTEPTKTPRPPVPEFDPPYNLTVEFKDDGVNRLELNWKLDGFVDEQRYYCSETPTDVSSLPAPKAVLPNGARTYIDTTIAAGKAYYIRVGSVRNSTEKISSEFKLYAIKSSSYVFNTSFASNLIDKTGKNWTPIGGAGVENGALNLNNQQKYLTTSKENFSFITTDDDFTIRLKLKVSSISAINVILSFRDYGNYSTIKGFAMYIIDGKLQFEGFKNTDVAAVSLSAPIPNFSTSVRDVSIERKNMIVYLYYDGILIGQATQVGNIYAPLRAELLPSLGRMSDDSRYYLDGTISDFQIINFAVGDGQPTTPKL